MKVKLAFYPHRLRVPQVCSRCASPNPPFQYVKEETTENLDWTGKRWRKWSFNFPCCMSCAGDEKKSKGMMGLLRGKKPAVATSIVQKKKYGKMFRKKELPFIEFEFQNEQYGELFKQANSDILFDKVLVELEEGVK